MKKQIIILVVILLLSLAACTAPQPTGSGANTPESSAASNTTVEQTPEPAEATETTDIDDVTENVGSSVIPSTEKSVDTTRNTGASTKASQAPTPQKSSAVSSVTIKSVVLSTTTKSSTTATTTTTTTPQPTTTTKPFDIYEYVAYAREYGESLGLNYRDTLTGTSWNAPQRIRASIPDEIIRAGVRASLDILAMENMTYFKLYLDEELDLDGYYLIYYYYA